MGRFVGDEWFDRICKLLENEAWRSSSGRLLSSDDVIYRGLLPVCCIVDHKERVVFEPGDGCDMKIAQTWWLGNVALLGAIWGHLMESTVCTASNQLFAPGTPGRATNLGAKSRPVCSSNERPLFQVCHHEVSIVRHYRAEPRQLRHRIGCELAQCFSICIKLECRLG